MMLIRLKPLILSPIIKLYLHASGLSHHRMNCNFKSIKTLIDIINISTGRWKQKESARKKKRRHKGEEEGEISSACTLMHCISL